MAPSKKTTKEVTPVAEPPKTYKREKLQELEQKAQTRWDQEKLFEINAPGPDEPADPKFMATFPFPYMNGLLHLGHSFSLSKVEFAVAYERMKGKRALFPFGFHVTGMPIKACADKLKNEIKMFGEDFSGYAQKSNPTAESEPEVEEEQKPAENGVDPTKIVKKHGKAAAKKTGDKYQFQIMRSMGVPNEEIKKFADPIYWLYYFPPLAIEDLKRFGAHVDWRRSFITTDVNPYFDSFVRWQFNQLKSSTPPRVAFGERYTIYSPLDGQPCMDHDRSSGEGVGVQEYTGIKLQVLVDDVVSQPEAERDTVKGLPVGQKIASAEILKALGGRKVFLVAATLRPETMYGQTNCYVGVDIEYGVYAVNNEEAWVCTERAARNMAYQGLFEERGVMKKLADLKGWDLVGMPLKAPLSPFDKVYTLPMEGVLETKGTGVVTSVPSDSPDDYVTLQDLLKKPAYYNVQTKWIEPFLPPRPIIDTPNFGNLAAVKAVKDLKINSQKDKPALKEAKELVYKEGFYNGVMLVGNQAGKSVQEAKPLVRAQLIQIGEAFPYCEPEGLVISRSGDECVVTLAPQWYMDYGEASWKKLAEECLSGMETFSTETRNAFEKNLDWLGQWACSRSFGLGSRLPWDQQYLIESLSDSTIYMAYYTVAHMLHGGVLDGSKPGSAGIAASDMTDAVWSYILLNGPYPSDTKIPQATLDKLRREFEYFYPLDLRCSGKDLVTNHLTFFIYNHTAIFPKEKWPKAVRANGHLLLNGDKMSKSTGNFLTIRQALDIYGADATRFALADAGDGMEDANYLDKTADEAILKLFTEKEWMEEVLKEAEEGKLRTGPLTWNDRVFEAELAKLVADADKAYQSMLYREAVKVAFFELTNARGEYRKATMGSNVASGSDDEKFERMHKDLVLKYIEIQALVLAPITPHWSEHIWSDLLKKPQSIQRARWPSIQAPADSEALLAAAGYVRGLGSRIRSTEDQASKKKAKKGAARAAPVDPDAPRTLRLYVGSTFPSWQDEALAVLKETWDEAAQALKGNEKELLAKKGLMKNKQVMPFVVAMKQSIEQLGPKAFDRQLPFDELETLEANLDFIRRDLSGLKISRVEVLVKESLKVGEGGVDGDDVKKAESAYIEIQALVLAPITPHWSEHIWSDLLKKPQSIQRARWPSIQAPADSEALLAAAGYVRGLGSRIRSTEDQASKKKAKKGAARAAPVDPDAPRTLRLYVGSTFPSWQDEALAVLKETWDEAAQALKGNEKELLAKKGLMKNKQVMPFVVAMKQSIEQLGPKAFDRQLPFDELETLEANLDFIRRDLSGLKISRVEVLVKESLKVGEGGVDGDDVKKAESAVPGHPQYRII
ncbi:cytosolic leucyl tRNA synthetase [Borealophlyctis nickersoniae]|nr:cytosolic leucyl tRNA synthetase [Borealophlyctis nickersoniae]